MNLFFENIKKWFGYTRRERSATTILLIIIVLVLLIRLFIPKNSATIEVGEYLFETAKETPMPLVTGFDAGSEGYNNKDHQYNLVSGADATTAIAKPLKNNKKEQVKLELNNSDSLALEALPAIGQVLSLRIIKYRNLLGGFYSVEQLKEVYGLSEEAYGIIKDRVYVDSSLVVKVPINEADYRTLLRMPYLEKEDVDAIIRYRKIVKKIDSLAQLINEGVITKQTADKAGHYLDFASEGVVEE